MSDNVNRPKHYNSHPSGVECIQITRHFNFNIGNAIKYLWRAGLKGAALEDLKKALWYINDEIKRLEKPEVCKEQLDLIEYINALPAVKVVETYDPDWWRLPYPGRVIPPATPSCKPGGRG